MKGRKPKPTKLKVMNGSAAHDPGRINQLEPDPPAGAPDKPDYLDEIASGKWDELCAILQSMEILSTADRDILEQYCVTYSQYRQALINVGKTGQVLVTRKDGETEVKRNPFTLELHKYQDRLKSLLPEMGLTASSRTRVQKIDTKRSAVASRKRA